MGKIELQQIGDMACSCPKCGNANAMLHDAREVKSKNSWEHNFTHYLKCRDCGFSVLEEDVIEVHSGIDSKFAVKREEL
jgi:predicted nucleic-acid-binding Zn-ribbon protein